MITVRRREGYIDQMQMLLDKNDLGDVLCRNKVWKTQKAGGKFEMYRNTVLVVGLCLCSSFLAIAQTAGTISGTVSDATGALIPGALVTVKNLDTGLTRELVSDEQGRYSAPNLPVGNYEVQTSLTGFRT